MYTYENIRGLYPSLRTSIGVKCLPFLFHGPYDQGGNPSELLGDHFVLYLGLTLESDGPEDNC